MEKYNVVLRQQKRKKYKKINYIDVQIILFRQNKNYLDCDLRIKINLKLTSLKNKIK